MTTTDRFESRIDLANDKLIALQQQAAAALNLDTQPIFMAALGDLATALEELHVIAEELNERNAELLAARADLDAERQHYADLFEFAPDGYLVTSPTGVIEEANQAAAELLGVRADHLTHKPLVVFVAEAERSDIYTSLAKLASSQQPLRWEMTLQPRHGEARPVAVQAVASRDAHGQVNHLRWLIQDITELKHAEQELRKLARAVEQSPATIVITDTTGAIEYANPKFTQTTGYTVDEARGQNPRILKSGEMNAQDYQQLWATITAGGGWHGEFHNKKKNGDLYWEAATIAPIWDEHGAITHFVAVKEDITARKQMEEALHDSEARAQAMLRAIPDLIFRIDRQGVYLDYKADIRDLYVPTNPIGQRNRDLTPPDFADLIDRQISLTLETGALQTFEYQLPIPGRGRRDYEARMTPSGADEVTAIVRDVTDRKQAEAALRENEEKYRRLFQDEFNAISIVDLETLRFLDVNPAYEQTYGYSHAELVGHLTIHDVTAEHEAIDTALRQAADGTTFIPLIYHRKKDGTVFPVEIVGGPYLWKGRKVMFTSAHDITARKQMEDVLRIQHDLSLTLNASTQLQPALEHILQAALLFEGVDCGGVYLTDPVTGAIELVVHYGLSPLFIDYVTHYPADRPQVQLMRSGQPFYGTYQDEHFQLDPIRAAENLRSFAAIPVLHQEQLFAVLNLASHTHDALPDRTRQAAETLAQQIGNTLVRLRADAALRDLNATLEQRVADRTRELSTANARLHELDHLKDQFISRISHELRTPLTSIKLYLEMLDTVKPDKRAKYLLVLTEQTNRLQTLIENLLEVTARNIGPVDLHLHPTDLNHLVASLAADLEPRAAARSLTLTTILTPDLPLVATDAILLTQALTSLTANALNYTPAGGALKLTTVPVNMQGQTWLTITVRDTGPGIQPDELPYVFDRFYRGRAADDYKTPGAGVGLSISHDILTALGGRLTVQSDGVPGHGTAFTAWLKAMGSSDLNGLIVP